MFCSTIIPTIGRPSLDDAVRSVLSQNFDAGQHEVIVVNDSGKPLPQTDWSHCEAVRVLHTGRRERSVARNAGAAVATGKYLHFLDDDDVLLPGALEAFWTAAQTTTADWLQGGWQTVNNNGELVEEFRPPIKGEISALLVSGEGLPFQASLLLAASFFEIGGYDSSSSILGVEDRDLGRRISQFGTVGHVPEVVARIRIGEAGSTTQWSAIAERDRWGREKALNALGAFSKLRRSAVSAYWRGRVCRAYCASAVWNLQQGSVFTAISRAFPAASFAGAGLLSPSFWKGLRTRIK
jgi:glycosyltransferase involved in cell wall biosynthesis